MFAVCFFKRMQGLPLLAFVVLKKAGGCHCLLDFKRRLGLPLLALPLLAFFVFSKESRGAAIACFLFF